MRLTLFISTAIVMSFMAGCDVVTSNYESLQDARDDSLFQQRWLPDILPDSTVAIRVSNDLDINVSEGEFTVAVGEIGGFMDGLSAVQEPYIGHANYIARMQKRGYEAFSYTDGMTWLFLCNRETGHCTYKLPYSGQGS